jgi:hypothetical protein
MIIRFPLLSGNSADTLPGKGGGCIVCNTPFQGSGFAYLSAGATYDLLESRIDDNELEAFFDVGYHGSHSDMSDSGGVEVVKDLKGGQFDLQFCSASCLRQFLSSLVDEVEKSIGQNKEVAAEKEKEAP